jgi:hypothetical protein
VRAANLLSNNLQFLIAGFPPPQFCEVSNASPSHHDPFGEQQGALGKEIPTIASQPSAGCNDPMAGDGRVIAVTHDVADGSMRARPARCGGNISICGNTTVRNATDSGAYTGAEISHGPPVPLADARARDFHALFTACGLILA